MVARDSLRIATWNVEWFAALFDREGVLRADDAPARRHGVSRRTQAEAIAIVLSAVDPDAILIVEAPDDDIRRSARISLESFAETYGLRQRRALLGFANDTQQEIVLLYDPDVVEARHDPDPGTAEAPRFDGQIHIDLDLDARNDPVAFSKPPLEAVVRAGDLQLRLIGVHVKSKAPHGARDAAQAMRMAIQNRRKQLAQCIWLRRRVDAVLDRGEPLIVLGDFNDGPGLDDYEALFGRSGLEVVLGCREACRDGATAEGRLLHDPHARPARGHATQARPVSARFWAADRQQYFGAMLDYIMLSADLMARDPKWRIWHPFDDPRCSAIPELREALLQASDHFPVTLDLRVNMQDAVAPGPDLSMDSAAPRPISDP